MNPLQPFYVPLHSKEKLNFKLTSTTKSSQIIHFEMHASPYFFAVWTQGISHSNFSKVYSTLHSWDNDKHTANYWMSE